MLGFKWAITLLLILMIMGVEAVAADDLLMPPSQPTIKDLGNNRYQVGNIEIDKSRGLFRVPGKIILTDPPLEFLAVTKGGQKAYESLMELEANAYEFNLACILIGLDAAHAKGPEHHFDPAAVDGDRVDMVIEWRQNSQLRSVAVAELLDEGEKSPQYPKSDWVYIGSRFTQDGRYLADLAGVLISFVHTPESIIEHRAGVGLGNYGAVKG
ncbi:MAG: hypothetical protein FD130_2589, partial [Halothiobacillaceae bacterium]